MGGPPWLCPRGGWGRHGAAGPGAEGAGWRASRRSLGLTVWCGRLSEDRALGLAGGAHADRPPWGGCSRPADWPDSFRGLLGSLPLPPARRPAGLWAVPPPPPCGSRASWAQSVGALPGALTGFRGEGAWRWPDRHVVCSFMDVDMAASQVCVTGTSLLGLAIWMSPKSALSGGHSSARGRRSVLRSTAQGRAEGLLGPPALLGPGDHLWSRGNQGSPVPRV